MYILCLDPNEHTMFHLESYCFGTIEAETKFVKKKYGVLNLDSLLADF